MTKAAAYHAFWSGFGIQAYEENSVPDGADRPAYPYITYEYGEDAYSDYPLALTVTLWDRNTSRVPINAKASEISAAIGREYGDAIPCDGGHFRLKRGSPWAMSFCSDESTVEARNDDAVQRIVFNVMVQWNTFY